MGTKICGIGGESQSAIDRGERTDTESTSAENTRTGRAGRAGRAGTGERTASEEEKLPGLAVVSEEDKKREERNAKRRVRYAEKKKAEPKKLTPKGKKKDADCTQVEAVLMCISGIVSSREGCAHWQLTPDETKSLAQPIANMMAQSEALAGLNEHTDAVALVAAAFGIFMPRIMISTNIRKEKKKHDRKSAGNTGTGAGGKQTLQDSGNVRDSGGQPTNTNGDDGKISAEFGNALC